MTHHYDRCPAPSLPATKSYTRQRHSSADPTVTRHSMVPNKPKKRRAHPPRCCGKHCQNAQQDCGRDPQPHTLDTHSSCCARQQTQGRYAIPSVHQMRPTAHENATAALHAHTHTHLQGSMQCWYTCHPQTHTNTKGDKQPLMHSSNDPSQIQYTHVSVSHKPSPIQDSGRSASTGRRPSHTRPHTACARAL